VIPSSTHDLLVRSPVTTCVVTDFIPGGAGTSTNMNANEVIANLALESLGHTKGEYQYVNPKIGKYIINHSFMIPGLVATFVAVLMGLVLAKLMF
jgi:aspartate ammonia-lyase